MRLIAFWRSHAGELAALLGQHVFLVFVSTVAAVVLGVPIGILAARRPRLGAPIVWLANVAQTIPSLAMFGFLLPLPFVGGLGARVAISVLVLYALLPIIRTTVAGMRSIDPALVEAGMALGMTPVQLFRRVELPLALPSIVAGIRVATVIGVGTATIAAAVGAGGLGEYIFRGLSMVEPTVILAGAVPAALLALTFDGTLTLIERAIRRAIESGGARRSRVLVSAAAVGLLAAGAVTYAALRPARDVVRVGSKNFTEQILLGELLAQTIETQTGVKVERRLNLGGTFICDRALRSGDIDVYVEYSGTALTAVFHQPVQTDPRQVLDTIRQRYAQAGVTLLDPLGFENTFAILVRGSDASSFNLKTIGDVGAAGREVEGGLRLRVPPTRRRLPGPREGVQSALQLAANGDGFVADLSGAFGASGGFDRGRCHEWAHRRLWSGDVEGRPSIFSAVRRSAASRAAKCCSRTPRSRRRCPGWPDVCLSRT